VLATETVFATSIPINSIVPSRVSISLGGIT
jgi:hypothetical protein